MTFTTSTDEIVRRKTIAIFYPFIFIPLLMFQMEHRWIWFLIFFLFYSLIIFYSYLKRPTKYKIEGKNIIICRPMGNREIKVNDIENVAQITDDLLKTAFTGGAFGYLGNFNTSLGKIRFYATRRNKLLMLKMKDNRKIVITPDDSTAFIAELSKISSAIQQQF